MKRFWVVLLICLAVSPVVLAEEVKDADLKQYLAGVTERGRALYAYDQAAWQGTDAFFQLKPDTAGLTHYICQKTSGGWIVSFPKWNATHDRLMVVYEAKQSGGKFVALKFDKPSAAREDLLARERAIELATADFGVPKRPYNSAILTAPEGNLYVYFYPGQTRENVWPLGGDVRYTVSPDGLKILEKRQLHSSILDMEVKPDSGATTGGHSHFLSDVPEDTDVLYVLNRRPSLPEYISSPQRAFIVKPNGSIVMTKPCGKEGASPCQRPGSAQN
jgi:hypothetical protein